MAARDILSALEVADYRWLWAGGLASQFAMNMQIVARGWLVYSLTSSALALAWVTLSFMLPQALFALWGGVVADRLSKRRIIVAAQSCNCALTFAMAAVILSGQVEIWHFLITGFANGTILALSMPARQAYIPELLSERLIITGMALNTTSWNLARILGPALAGLLIAVLADGERSTFGTGIVYCAIGVLYGLAALTTLGVRAPGLPRRRVTSSPLQDALDGLRYVRAHPPVLGLILLSVVPFLFGMPLNTLLPAFNEQVLKGGPEDLGLLISCMGGGAIMGSLLLAALGNLRRRANWIIASALAWGVLTACFGAASQILVASAVVALIGLVSAWNMALNRGLLQTEVTPAMRGRIMSIDMMSHGLMPLGVLPISLIADRFGLQAALECAGGVFVIVILVLASGTRAVRVLREPREPALP